MRRLLAMTVAMLLAASSAQAQVTVNVPDSTAPWLGFMNVFELPENGGGFVFGSGWGTADLVTEFDDANNKLTFSPNTIGDPNEFWYQNTTGMAPDPVNPGGPGQRGNKSMEANLYIEVNDDSLAGQMVTFEGNILSDTYTDAHQGFIFIRDFAPDYSSSNDTIVPISGAGPFSISLMTDPGLGRHVQYGFRSVGENVWVTDTAPFGNFMVGTIPEPATLSLLGFGAVALLRRRR